MKSLLSLQPSKIFAASRFARKGVQVKKVEYRLIPLNKPLFLGPILVTALFWTIFVAFDFCFAQEVSHKNLVEALGRAISNNLVENANQIPDVKERVRYIVRDVEDHIDGFFKKPEAEAIVKSFEERLLKFLEDPEPPGKFLTTGIVRDYFKTAVNDIARPKTELEQKVNELSEQVDILNARIKPKMLCPNKEVEFLFDAVIGDSYSPRGIDRDFEYRGHPITRIEDFRLQWKFWRIGQKTRVLYKKGRVDTLPEINDDLINGALEQPTNKEKVEHIVAKVKERLLAFYEKPQAEKIWKSFQDKLLSLLEKPQGNLTTSTAQIYFKRAVLENVVEEKALLSDSEALEYKMLAVEDVLRLDPMPNDTVIKRIERAHTEIKNYEWARDYLRFGILVNHIPGIQANATSIALSAYPSYRRFMPGTVDPVRRMSIFFAAGTVSTVGETEAKGMVYSYGIGCDIIRGVGFAIGGSTYNFRELRTEDYRTETSLSLGISLNSELWKGLFGK